MQFHKKKGDIKRFKGHADNMQIVKLVYIHEGYTGKQYVPEKIYFQSDGGAWMKKGIETLGAEFVLDGFHIQKYIRRMARLAGGTEETKEENRKKIQE